jgi:hypothetical protein
MSGSGIPEHPVLKMRLSLRFRQSPPVLHTTRTYQSSGSSSPGSVVLAGSFWSSLDIVGSRLVVVVPGLVHTKRREEKIASVPPPYKMSAGRVANAGKLNILVYSGAPTSLNKYN